MKRAGLAALYLGWLYGVTFLLVVGLIRRTSSPYLATHAQAQAFGATTDTYLTAALVVNLVLPIAGALCAWLLDDRYWMQHFFVALGGMVLVFLMVAVVAGQATAPLIGWVPTDHEPAPRVTQCIPVSGGHGCPGG
jgi:hypothetical protein